MAVGRRHRALKSLHCSHIIGTNGTATFSQLLVMWINLFQDVVQFQFKTIQHDVFQFQPLFLRNVRGADGGSSTFECGLKFL